MIYKAPGRLQIKQISGKTFEDLDGQSFTFSRVETEWRVVWATFPAFGLISGCPICFALTHAFDQHWQG